MTAYQVISLFLDLSLIVVVAQILGVVATRLGQPRVIGEVLAGIALGPAMLGTQFSAAVFPQDVRPMLAVLANLGITLFMFVVGLELDGTAIRAYGRVAATVSATALITPFCLGTALAYYLTVRNPSWDRPGFAVFIGAAMSVTAFPVLARILTDRQLTRTTVGGLALTCAAISDVMAWSLLAIVVVLAGGTGQWLLLLFPFYVAGMFLVVRPLLRKVLRAGTRLSATELTVTLAGVLISSAATEWMGLHFIFGAFLFGAVMPRAGGDALLQSVTERVGDLNNTLLLPGFFIMTGLRVQLSGIGAAGLGLLGLIVLVAFAGKFGGAFIGARLCRLPVRESAALATLMNTRGLTELIILTVGIQLGVIDQRLYSLMVLMAVITTAMTGPMLSLIHPPTQATLSKADPSGLEIQRPSPMGTGPR